MRFEREKVVWKKKEKENSGKVEPSLAPKKEQNLESKVVLEKRFSPGSGPRRVSREREVELLKKFELNGKKNNVGGIVEDVVRRTAGVESEKIKKTIKNVLFEVGLRSGEELRSRLETQPEKFSVPELGVISGISVQRGLEIERSPSPDSPPAWESVEEVGKNFPLDDDDVQVIGGE